MRLGSKQICIVGQLQSSEVLHKIHASGNVTIFSKLRQIAILFFSHSVFLRFSVPEVQKAKQIYFLNGKLASYRS